MAAVAVALVVDAAALAAVDAVAAAEQQVLHRHRDWRQAWIQTQWVSPVMLAARLLEVHLPQRQAEDAGAVELDVKSLRLVVAVAAQQQPTRLQFPRRPVFHSSDQQRMETT